MVNLGRLLVVFTLVLYTGKLSAQAPDTTFWVPNGPVNSVILHDTTVIIGGDFDQLCPVTGSFVRMDTGTAQVDPSLFKVNGAVYATYLDTNGYLYVGGSFTRAGNQTVENIFRLKPNGMFDNTFSHMVNGTVYCIAKHDSDLFIGGDFTQIDGETRNYFGAINLNNGDVNFCDPNLNGPVYCMQLDTFYHQIIIGGDFTQVQNFGPKFLAKIDMASGAPFTFNAVPWTAVPNTNGPVYDIELVGAYLYIAGEFTQFSSTQRRGLARLLNTNGYLQTEDANLSGFAYAINVVGNNLYVGGSFNSASSQSRSKIACFDLMFTLLPWNPGANGTVRTLSVVDSNGIFIGGDFSIIGGDTIGRGAIVNRLTGTVRNWNPKFNATVFTAAIDTLGRLYVGGAFFGAGGIFRNNLCALSVNIGTPTAWNPNVNNTVRTMTLDGDSLYLAGDFTNVTSAPRGRIAAFDLNTLALLPFNPGVNGVVRTICITDTAVYFGGNFTQLGGQGRNNIGRVNKSTALAMIWNPYCYGTVNRILVSDGWVYVAGFYNTISGVNRQNLARLNEQNGVADPNWICDTDDGIYEAQFYNGKLALGGWFTTVNGQASPAFAILDTLSLQVSPVTFSCDGFVKTFTTYGDDFFMSGSFQIVNAQFHPNLVGYDEGNNSVDSWTPAPNASPNSMQATATRLYVGGGMTTTSSRFHPYFQVLSIQWVTSINETHMYAPTFEVWPVPATDFITISSATQFSDYTITDITGKIVQAGELESGSGTQTLSVSDLANGMYILNLSTSGGVWAAQKIIVE